MPYPAGRGVPQSDDEAKASFERGDQAGLVSELTFGCDYGNAYGCFCLGYVHRHGLYLPKDEGAARRFFERSCPGVEWGCDALDRPRGDGT